MLYLVDTNTCIHAMKGSSSVLEAMGKCEPGAIAISSVTCFELYTGVEKCRDPQRERAKVDILINELQPIGFDILAAWQAARIRASLESLGQMIGPYDVLIAGHARSLGLILVTANTNEFRRVSGLTVENWAM